MGDRAPASLVVRPGEGVAVRNPVGGSIELKAVDAHEAIYFLEGTFRMRLEDDVHEAPAGTFVFVPKDVPHTWQNSGDTAGRLLAIFAPASVGMEAFFQRFAATTSASAAD